MVSGQGGLGYVFALVLQMALLSSSNEEGPLLNGLGADFDSLVENSVVHFKGGVIPTRLPVSHTCFANLLRCLAHSSWFLSALPFNSILPATCSVVCDDIIVGGSGLQKLHAKVPTCY